MEHERNPVTAADGPDIATHPDPPGWSRLVSVAEVRADVRACHHMLIRFRVVRNQ